MKEMKKKLNKLAIFFFFMASLCYQNKVFAQKYSNAFLQIGVGAAGQGLAYACVANTDNTIINGKFLPCIVNGLGVLANMIIWV
jgi:hypothetical protein